MLMCRVCASKTQLRSLAEWQLPQPCAAHCLGPAPFACTHADKRYQGLQGIVVRDTANTLQLVTRDNRFVVIPKQVGYPIHACWVSPRQMVPCGSSPSAHATPAGCPGRRRRHSPPQNCGISFAAAPAFKGASQPASRPNPTCPADLPPAPAHSPSLPPGPQLCTWEFDADRRRVVTLLGSGLAQRGTGIAIGGAKPKTLREAIRGQQRG